MQFLRTLFWVVLAVIAVIFAARNWTPVTISLWGGLQADAKLPVMLFAAFLIGFVPTYLLYRASRWSLRRRLDISERALADLRGVTPAGTIADEPELPPGAAPSAFPPAV